MCDCGIKINYIFKMGFHITRYVCAGELAYGRPLNSCKLFENCRYVSSLFHSHYQYFSCVCIGKTCVLGFFNRYITRRNDVIITEVEPR